MRSKIFINYDNSLAAISASAVRSALLNTLRQLNSLLQIDVFVYDASNLDLPNNQVKFAASVLVVAKDAQKISVAANLDSAANPVTKPLIKALGASYEAAVISSTAPETTSSPVSSVLVSSAPLSSAATRLSWSAPLETWGSVLSYSIFWKKTSESAFSFTNVSAGSLTVNITGLSAGAAYEFFVSAVFGGSVQPGMGALRTLAATQPSCSINLCSECAVSTGLCLQCSAGSYPNIPQTVCLSSSQSTAKSGTCISLGGFELCDGAFYGACAGVGVAVLLIIAFFIIVCCRRSRENKYDEEAQVPEEKIKFIPDWMSFPEDQRQDLEFSQSFHLLTHIEK